MRLRLTFAKNSQMRFTGHLDLHRAWERTIRRAGLPLAYTQGFSPHPRINLASALPLGFTGEAEVLDLWLEQPLPLDEIYQALAAAVPPGIEIVKLEEIDPHLPTAQAVLEASDYSLTVLEPVTDLAARLAGLLAAAILPSQRRGKPYDLRPLILSAETLPPDEAGCQRLRLRLTAREGATGRPDAVLEALGLDLLAARVHRLGLVLGSGT